ncbi:hypothetical protein AQJ66_13805 [Streptomyces bungoensis]|uniref:Uncharacterized protein n=1 Tax=Streptomyces bungoensis TaxID=285568 RepID=A0A101T4H4_9ACTN|nr:hypothetical protein [Streptomyces bungoensis]KUN85572.1 hypothetical protein AQJ66_13805 [Streptomyces bungoensis]
MTASRPPARPARPSLRTEATGVSMRELLASCAAADAVSRPPRAPDPERPGRAEKRPQAA